LALHNLLQNAKATFKAISLLTCIYNGKCDDKCYAGLEMATLKEVDSHAATFINIVSQRL